MSIELIRAVNANNLREVERLLIVERVNVNYIPSSSEAEVYGLRHSAIRTAIENGNLTMAKLLKKCCPTEFNPDAARNKDSRALHYLFCQKVLNLKFETVAFLLASGANFDDFDGFNTAKWFTGVNPAAIQELLIFEALIRGNLTFILDALPLCSILHTELLFQYLHIFEPRYLAAIEKEEMQKCFSVLDASLKTSKIYPTLKVIEKMLNEIPVYKPLKHPPSPSPANLVYQIEGLSKKLEVMMDEIKNLQATLASKEKDVKNEVTPRNRMGLF